ncbi:MAG: AGROH133_08824 family phage infection protein [Rhizobiaceae bacterium]
MGLSFPWPASQGEWLAWVCAAITVLSGLFFLFAPRAGLRFLRLQTMPAHPEALSESRGTIAGFYLGIGLSCVLLAQPLLYMALGFSWGFTAFGRLVSMLSDKGATLYNIFAFVLEIVLAALPLAFAFGFLP